MPLDKSGSDESVGRNIETEVAAGKPRKQAIAIALDVQRHAGGGKKAGRRGPRKYRRITSTRVGYED